MFHKISILATSFLFVPFAFAEPTPAESLCTWAKVQKEISEKVDAPLSVFNSEKNTFDVYGTVNPDGIKEIECLQDKVILWHEAEVDGKTVKWKKTLTVTNLGNVALETGNTKKGIRKTTFSGDGINELRVQWHDNYEISSAIDISNLFKEYLTSYLLHGIYSCDKSLQELEAMGVKKIVSTEVSNRYQEFVYTMKLNGKYAFRNTELSGGYIKYTTDLEGGSFVCSIVKKFDYATN